MIVQFSSPFAEILFTLRAVELRVRLAAEDATLAAVRHDVSMALIHVGETEKLVRKLEETHEAQLTALDGRRQEGRELLRRLVKYVREDRAVTPGKTRLARLTDEVADYLARTADPNDVLRTGGT